MHTPLAPAALALATLAALASSPALADEGQWMPGQIPELGEKLRARGLEIEPGALWTDGDDKSLLRAVVNLSGCTASLISKDALVATNHHCAYRAIQAQSTPKQDYLKRGFLAPTRAEEIEAKGLTVKVLQSITDVTAAVKSSMEGVTDDAERARAVEKKQKSLVAECEASGALVCQVESFSNGSEFQLHTYVELLDVRLVYAPPSAIGRYGGEIDNWMWPRHSGDFTLLRVYVGPDGKPAPFAAENVPYQPSQWLTPSPDGVEPGDFVSTIGYPGHTDRYLSLPEVNRQTGQVLPAVVRLYQEWMTLQTEAAGDDEARQIKIAGRQRSLANREKNARGMIDGIARMQLAIRRAAEDSAASTEARKRGHGYLMVLGDLTQLASERLAKFDRHLLLRVIPRGADSLATAVTLVRWAKERSKDDLDRAEGYQDRDKERVWRGLDRRFATFDPVVDEALLTSWLRQLGRLPRKVAGTLQFKASAIVANTKLGDPAVVKAHFDAASLAELDKSGDPAIKLALLVVPAIEAMEEQQRAWRGRELVVGPKYFELIRSVRGGAVYPDANGTLRFSYATVKGYSPRDGLFARPQTTLAGQIAKDTGVDPFDLPDTLRREHVAGSDSYWADPRLGDIPVCFLSSSDTTGGNSGSPVIDARGRLVGLNFDRVWENIAGDFGYNPDRSRNISVDLRYLWWLLDDIVDAGALLEELGLSAYREKPRRPAPPPRDDDEKASGPIAASTPAAKPRDGRGCSATTPSGSALALILLGGLQARRRRRGAGRD